MGRKCKLTPEIQEKFSELLRCRFTIKQACYGMGISVTTFNRWRNRYSEFDKAMNEATSRQWEDPIALARYGCRTYRRKFSLPHKYPSLPQKPLCEPLCASQSLSTEQDESSQVMYGLPVGDMYASGFETNKKYYDPKLDRVFYRDESGCLCSMRLDVYLRQKHNDPLFLGVVV